MPGVRLGTSEVGIRYTTREDVTMMAFPAGTTVAGVFTKNRCPGAPVDWCREALKGGKARALVVTAGNSNVFTGKAGRDTCAATAAAMAELVGCRPKEVFLASTGVIGERMPTEKLTARCPPCCGAERRAWAGGGARHHHDRHLPEGLRRTARIGEATVTVAASPRAAA